MGAAPHRSPLALICAGWGSTEVKKLLRLRQHTVLTTEVLYKASTYREIQYTLCCLFCSGDHQERCWVTIEGCITCISSVTFFSVCTYSMPSSSSRWTELNSRLYAAPLSPLIRKCQRVALSSNKKGVRDDCRSPASISFHLLPLVVAATSQEDRKGVSQSYPGQS